MPKSYYLDTCIWRDYLEERHTLSGRPLGEYAAKFFQKIIKSRDKILFSDSIIIELKRKYSLEEINQILNLLFLIGILNKIIITKDEFTEAKQLAIAREIPLGDCLHAILARNHGAILVSQDKHILNNLSDIVKTRRPEQIT
ncbi:type II toxin-antitoxin system VapC family toxin [candidate division KSB1 bacterium]